MKTLIKIQAELKAHKSKTNSFGGYKYRSCEDILEAVKPLLKETECILTISDDIQLVGDRVYVKATATLKTKDSAFTTSAYAREPLEKKGMDSSQITGMASSYARKYALNGLFAIDDTQDADSMDNSEKPKVTTTVSSETLSEIDVLIVSTGTDLSKVLDYFKVASLTQLTSEQANKLITQLKAKQ